MKIRESSMYDVLPSISFKIKTDMFIDNVNQIYLQIANNWRLRKAVYMMCCQAFGDNGLPSADIYLFFQDEVVV